MHHRVPWCPTEQQPKPKQPTWRFKQKGNVGIIVLALHRDGILIRGTFKNLGQVLEFHTCTIASTHQYHLHRGTT